jgi:hypothetical protein
MSPLSPSTVLSEVAAAVPEICRQNIIVIGSLAAGYHFFGEDGAEGVRTKDVDCVLEPFAAAVEAGQTITRQLLDAGWTRRASGDHQKPGDDSTPEDQLPAVRLYPPGTDEKAEGSWFLELLTVPANPESEGRVWTRLPLAEGHFALPTFRYLSIAAHNPLQAGNLGIRYARPKMMALANLLEHPTIKPDRMSSLFGGRAIKRSNKDLGRVLAIATLSNLNDFGVWVDPWKEALEASFPAESKSLAVAAGDGLRKLLASPGDLEEAAHTCANGLLATRPPTIGALRAVGERLLGDALEVLAEVV